MSHGPLARGSRARDERPASSRTIDDRFLSSVVSPIGERPFFQRRPAAKQPVSDPLELTKRPQKQLLKSIVTGIQRDIRIRLSGFDNAAASFIAPKTHRHVRPGPGGD